MDNLDTSSDTTSDIQKPNDGDTEQEEELSHSDKLMGIFSEPGKTFERMAKFPPRTIDWLLPLVILLVVVIATQFLVLSNNAIYYQVKQKQLERIQQNFKEAVAKGQMTQDQANEQMNRIEDNMEKGRTPIAMVTQAVGIIILGFIFFFIVSGIYFLFSKFAFKGDGTYNSVLVANGMTSYIAVLQIIIAAILALLMGKMVSDTSVAAFVNVDRASFLGFILAKINPISIWVYIVLSIGLAKMFKVASAAKFYVMVFGLWIGWGLLIWGLGKAVPFLRFLAG